MVLVIEVIQSLSLPFNIALLIAGGVVVWIAGTKLSTYADAIAVRTGAGHAFVGALFLGGATSLPEVATTFTASYIGSASIAVNNIFGGVAFQVVVLAILDFMIRGKALSFAIKDTVVSVQATLSALLIAFILAGIIVTNTVDLEALSFEFQSVNISLWTICTFLFAVAFFYVVKKIQHIREGEKKPEQGVEKNEHDSTAEKEQGHHQLSNKKLTIYSVLAAVAILAGGFVVASNGDTIASKTGLGEGLVGGVFIAVTTSLPELSTGIAAIRLKNYELLCSDIFGSNIFDLSLFFLADILYSKGSLLADVNVSAQFSASLAIMLTLVYAAGFLLRRNRSYMRAGVDSWAVLLLYVAGVTLLVFLKQ